MSAEAFYNEGHHVVSATPTEIFKFAEAYAAHVSQVYERRVRELEKELEDEKRADAQIQEQYGKMLADLETAELQLAEARETLQRVKTITKTRRDLDALREIGGIVHEVLRNQS